MIPRSECREQTYFATTCSSPRAPARIVRSGSTGISPRMRSSGTSGAHGTDPALFEDSLRPLVSAGPGPSGIQLPAALNEPIYWPIDIQITPQPGASVSSRDYWFFVWT
jgi:hypothetical protein